MNIKYIEFNGKHPKNSKEYRKYSDVPSPSWLGYGCSYDAAFLKVDIDDYDRNTGTLEDPIRGLPRSEAIVTLLDSLGIKYNGIRTEHGKHLFFRRPATLEERNKQNWYCTIGIKGEWKFPGRDDHIPLVINGVERQFFKGSITNTDIDDLPCFLMPLQKAKDKPFDLTFPSGDRTQKLCAYLFHLIKKGYSAEETFSIIRLMNDHVFEDPIPEDTLTAQILNDSTLAKLTEQQKDTQLTPDGVADEIIDHFGLIRVNGDYYAYQGGVYKPFNADELRAYVTTTYPKLNGNFEREITRHVEGRSYTKPPVEDGLVNLKNGFLSFDEAGEATFHPHSRETISFRQFNAVFNPDVTSPLLERVLGEWFNENPEQVQLFNQMLGYLLMNHVDYQKIFFFIGPPSSGKSTMLQLVTAFCGFENVSAVTFDDLNREHGLENLVNKTANICADMRNTKVKATDKFKKLADAGGFDVNPKYRKPFTYSYKGKMLFGMNEYPDFSGDFEGIERRLVIFRFHRVFNDKQDGFNPQLLKQLTSEEAMSALLNHALEGYKALKAKKGFIETKSSGKALEDFVMSNDNIKLWLTESKIDEAWLLNEPINYNNSGCFPDYLSFCFNAGEEPKTQQAFSRYITQEFGFTTYRKRTGQERIRFFRRKDDE